LTSDISLLELSDTNSPLLKKLQDEVPGTFQHALQVANLAESGVAAIGGNVLLARAGALYHDIGKMKNPQFFIENQHTSVNPHDDLDPETSAKLIIQHVINGIELAKRHNIPDRIIDFIRTHHGTSLVQYFYRQYVKENPENEAIKSIDNFRYPGPKPFSKETAVLMMADSVEAASKSIKEPDVTKINTLVDKIIESQMNEGQFDHADISLKQISLIKKIFKEKLRNIYHLRIEYPD
ncbi:MAG: HDIG domain-containing metalloprotein, partial [Flavobacteriales bacterium]